MPSKGYSADQNEDGTWNVRRVPVFAVHERFGKQFDRAWLNQAVARHAELAASGYMAPTHVQHHGKGDEVGPAGFFHPVAVEDMSFAGQPARPVILADLLKVPAEVYARMADGRLPYVSVELGTLDQAEITSLALMDHRAPYFQFPLLTVREQPGPALASAEPVGAFAAGNGANYLWCFGQETTMPANYMTEEVQAAKAAMAEACAAFTEKLAALGAKVEEMVEELGGAPAADPEPEAEPEAAPAEIPAMAASAPTVSTTPESDAQYAAQATRIAALEAEVSAGKRARETEARVAAAEAELAQAGVTGVRDELLKFSAQGPEVLKAYVEATKAYAVPTPPEAWTGDIPAPTENPAVAAYHAGGPARLKAAREVAAIYEAMPASAKQRMPLDRLLVAELGAPITNGTGSN